MHYRFTAPTLPGFDRRAGSVAPTLAMRCLTNVRHDSVCCDYHRGTVVSSSIVSVTSSSLSLYQGRRTWYVGAFPPSAVNTAIFPSQLTDSDPIDECVCSISNQVYLIHLVKPVVEQY